MVGLKKLMNSTTSAGIAPCYFAKRGVLLLTGADSKYYHICKNE